MILAAVAPAAPGGDKGKPQPAEKQEAAPEPQAAEPQPTPAKPAKPAKPAPEPQAARPAKPAPQPTTTRTKPNSDGPKSSKAPGAKAPASSNSTGHGPAGKTTYCHSTRSGTNPYVSVTSSNNSLPQAHEQHHDGDDIIPATGDCPGSTARGGKSGSNTAGGGGSSASGHGPGGKATYCHSTRSESNPFVVITTSVNALWAHIRHHAGDDVIPATSECSSSSGSNDSGPDAGKGPQGPDGKATYCHSTRSETNPFVVITTSVNALAAHIRHHAGDDVIPAENGECPGDDGTQTVSDRPAGGDTGPEQVANGQGNGPGQGNANRPGNANGRRGDGDEGGADDEGDDVNAGGPGAGDDDGRGNRGDRGAEGAPGETGVLGESRTDGGDDAAGPGADGTAPAVAEEQADDGGSLPFTGRSLLATLVAALLALAVGLIARRVVGRAGV